MTKFSQKLIYPILVILVFGSLGLAQKPAEPEKAVAKIQIVLSRYDGDRRTSSLPFTMLASVDGAQVSVRTGAQVAVSTAAPDAKGGFQYVDVGTNIDCKVVSTDAGRFKVDVTISDRSVIDRPVGVQGTPGLNVPTLRNFTYTNSIQFRDGETKQFVAASDKGSGDVIRVDATLTIEK